MRQKRKSGNCLARIGKMQLRMQASPSDWEWEWRSFACRPQFKSHLVSLLFLFMWLWNAKRMPPDLSREKALEKRRKLRSRTRMPKFVALGLDKPVSPTDRQKDWQPDMFESLSGFLPSFFSAQCSLKLSPKLNNKAKPVLRISCIHINHTHCCQATGNQKVFSCFLPLSAQSGTDRQPFQPETIQAQLSKSFTNSRE